MDIWLDFCVFVIDFIRLNYLYVFLFFFNFFIFVIYNIQDDIFVFFKYDRFNMFEICMGNIKYEKMYMINYLF